MSIEPPVEATALRRSLLPSLRRAFGSNLSAFSLPLLALAAISAAKLLQWLGLIDPVGLLRTLMAWQSAGVEWLVQRVALFGITIPRWLVDAALFYVFVGNAITRSEQNELMAVELEPGERLDRLREGFVKLRAEFVIYAIPALVRGIVIRAFWPLVALHRLSTPWVVEGPGPDGEEISSAVRRAEIADFEQMVRDAGVWNEQTVFDHRQVIVWQILIGVCAAVALQAASRLAAVLLA